MKKTILLILLLIITLLPISADSESLNTEITSVSFGPHRMGFGFAPTGTNFMYHTNFQLSDKLNYPAYFMTRLIFSANNDVKFWSQDYDKGTPIWSVKMQDVKDWSPYISGSFFNPKASLTLFANQGFGTNPVEGKGPLLTLGLEWNTVYDMVLENLDTSRGTAPPVFINPQTGEYNNPFQPGNKINAYPHLQDTRISLCNSITANASINLSRYTGFGTSDGLSFNLSFEYAPSWLANSLTMAFPSADYYRLYFGAAQNLTLYTHKQDNGLNWLSIVLNHSNSIQHVGGEVVPKHKTPADTLRNTFTDTLSITFNGPQFIAWDCYTNITLSLNNFCFFGHVVNEPAQITKAMEWQSSLQMYFHMRLFGFMHFDYSFGYNFMTGIHQSHPGFYQQANIRFFIAL